MVDIAPAEAQPALESQQTALTPPSELPNGVPIYNIEGKEAVLGHMHPDDVHEAVASGAYSFPEGARVPVFSPEGDLGDVDASEAPQSFQSGYKYATPDAIKQHTYGTAGQQAATVAEGLAAGVISRPVTSAIEQGLGLTTGKDIEARREVNPWESGLSETAGLVGGALTGTGEAALLEKAGAATAKLLGPKGASALAKIGARSLSDATQMAIYQGGNEVSKLIEGNPPESVGAAMTDIGLSALLGAGVGGVFGAVSPLWHATGIGDKAAQGLENLKGRLNFLSKNPNLVEAAADELGALHGSTSELVDEAYGPTGLKAQGITKVMPELHEGMGAQAQQLSSKVEDTLTKMRETPNRYPNHLVEDLQDRYDSYLETATRPDASANDLFNAGQKFKQELHLFSKFEKRMTPIDPGYKFTQDVKGLGNAFKTSLEDSNVWGKAAELQEKVNKAFVDHLPASKELEKAFFKKSATGEMQLDPGKLETFINRAGSPKETLRQQALENYIKSSDKFKDVLSDVHRALGNESPIQPSSLSVLSEIMKKPTTGSKIADYFVKTGIDKLSGGALGAASGAGIGHLVGAPGWGAMLGREIAGPVFESVLHSMVKPALEKASNSAAFKTAAEFSKAVAKGEHAMNKATKGLFKGSGEVLTAANVPSESQRAKLDAQLSKIKSSPERLTQVGGNLGYYFPDHATALATQTQASVQYLQALKPNTSPALPLDPKLPANPVAKANYDRALNIAAQPLIVLNHISRGTLTPQDVTTLKATNPGAYQRISQKLMTEVTDRTSKGESIPYKTRQQLSLFVGQPLDSTMTPQGILGAQTKSQQVQQPTPTEGGSRPKSSTAKLGNIAKGASTQAQSRDARANKE